MDITIAICTWNRCELLRPTLERMCDLVIPPSVEWELLVIDNASEDATAATAIAFAKRLPVRVIFEPESGLSHARNRAVAEAQGDYIIWTDDDVLVDPHWLQAYHMAFQRHSEATVFGGPIAPWFEGDPPKWLRQGFSPVASAFAVRDLGEVEFPLTVRKTPWGANYAVRTEIQRRFPYDPRLGRNQAKSTMVGEEVSVLRAILATGAAGWWVPEARVRHWIPRARQTLAYIRDYYVGAGRSQSLRSDGINRAPEWTELIGPWLLAEATCAVQRAISRPDVWLSYFVRASMMKGQFKAALGR